MSNIQLNSNPNPKFPKPSGVQPMVGGVITPGFCFREWVYENLKFVNSEMREAVFSVPER